VRKYQDISQTWGKLSKLLPKQHKKKYGTMIVLSLLSALLEVVGVSILLHTILSILKPEFIQHNVLTSFLYHRLGVTDNRMFVLVITSLLFVIYVLKNTVLVQMNKRQVKLAFSITDYISGARYKQEMNQNLAYFKRRPSAEIINELTASTFSFSESILIASVVFLSELTVIVLLLGAILFYKPLLFLFTFFSVIPSAVLLIYVNKKKLAREGREVHELVGQVYTNISEMTAGIANIKLWNGSDYFHTKFERMKASLYELKASIYVKSNYMPMRIYEVIAITGILCVVLYGTLGDKGISSVISYISIYAGVSFRLLPSINRVIGTSNTLSTNSHILDFLVQEDNDEDRIKDEPVVFDKYIELSGIHFGYTPEQRILENINLKIAKGDFIGIVGNSGSGKSTLVNVLASLLSHTEGRLLVDGLPLRSSQQNQYRYLFSYVKQDVFMINDTILNNVAFVDESPNLERVLSCLDKVNLTEWIKTLSDGIYTPVGELGNHVSGGQRQRIAIARALYKDAEIFIFDEVTNNLDMHSRQQTLKAIEILKETGNTAIFITHKEDELKMCDHVYSLEENSLIEVC
jgi:ABC-type multidrug transport system fused ATPase/permease subunit